MNPLLLLLGIICAASALPAPSDVIVIESSNEDKKPEGRFVFAATVTTTAFSTTSTVTASSITHQFCYTTANAGLDCASNMLLPGRKRRRRDAIVEEPSVQWKFMLDSEEIDFDEFVAQFKPAAPRQAKAVEVAPQRLEFKRIEVEGLDDQCFTGHGYDGRGRQADTQPRFVTFRTTVTTDTTSTVTVTTTTAGQLTQSLWISSTANAGITGCFPSSILSSLSSLGPSLGLCG